MELPGTETVANFAAQCFQLHGGFALDPLTRGCAPGPRCGFRPSTPLYARCPVLPMGSHSHIALDVPVMC